MTKPRTQLGFTLIETIIYIALFSILIGTSVLAAYQIMEGSAHLGDKVTVQDEANFVLRKIDWALTGTTTGITTLTTPSVGTPYTTTLTVTKAANAYNPVVIRYNSASSSIEIQEGSGHAFFPLTTTNVKVTSLQFQYMQASGTSPSGVTASSTIGGVVFVTTKYIRQ